MNSLRHIFAGLLVVTLLSGLGNPADAQNHRSKKDKDSEKEESSVKVLDSTEAQWFRRSVNDSVYGTYTVNGVFNERDKVRLGQKFNIYKPTSVKVGKLEQRPAFEQPEYKLRINGKTVEVKEEDNQ